MSEFLPQYAAQCVADMEEFIADAKRLDQARLDLISRERPDLAMRLPAVIAENNFMASMIRSAVHVVLPKNGEVYKSNFPATKPSDDELQSLRGLPAPVTCFEFYSEHFADYNKHLSIVVDRKQSEAGGDGLIIARSYFDAAQKKWVACSHVFVVPNPPTFVDEGKHKLGIYANCFSIYETRLAGAEKQTQYAPGFVGCLGPIIQCCHSLRAGALLEEQRETSPVRRWKMEKRGVGGFTYHVLKLPGGSMRQGTPTGTHDSPRFHVRRAHIRKLPSGVLTFVRQCFVGDPEKGVVGKHYQVKDRLAHSASGDTK